MGRATKGSGLLASRFTSMLESELGPRWQVLNVWPASGYWLKQDVYRIEGMLLSPRGFHVPFGAWETMTSIVKSGGVCLIFDTWCVEVYGRDNRPRDYEITWKDAL